MVSISLLLTEAEIHKYWTQVTEADQKDVASSVNHKVFDLQPNDATANNKVDGVWVCKWSNRR